MLIVDAAVTDGHIITRKLSHLCAKRNMFFCKWSILHCNHFVCGKNSRVAVQEKIMLLWIVFISFEAGERICMMLSLRRTLVLVNDESSIVNNYELILYLPFTIAH